MAYDLSDFEEATATPQAHDISDYELAPKPSADLGDFELAPKAPETETGKQVENQVSDLPPISPSDFLKGFETEGATPLSAFAPPYARKKAEEMRAAGQDPTLMSDASTPAFEVVPKISPEEAGKIARATDVSGLFHLLPQDISNRVAGIGENVISDTANFFTSPLGVATAGMGALPKLAQKAIAAGFLASTLKQAPERFAEIKDAKTPEERDKAITGAIEDAAVIGGTAMHVLESGRQASAHVENGTIPTPTEEAAKPATDFQKAVEDKAASGEPAPVTAAVVDKLKTETAEQPAPTPDALAQEHGVTYQGESNGLHAFKDETTGGNLSVPADELSSETLGQKVASVRQSFNGSKGVGDFTESDIDQAIAEASRHAVETLSGMGDREQEIVRRHTMSGDSFDEIAQDLGISTQQAEKIHAATIEKIGNSMQEAGYSGGPGAMGPVEALEMAAKQKITSIKNAVVDQGRAAAELPAREKPLKRAFGAVWDEAKHIIDVNPEKGRELVDELSKKTRPLTDTEDAILTHEQMDRQAAYDNAVEHVNNATDPVEKAEAQSALQRAREDMFKIYEVGQKAGTENARGLNARRMMVREDYSLAKVEARARAANNGEPLNEKQLSDLKAAHEKIADLEKKIQEAEEKGRDATANHYFEQLLAETKRDVKESIKKGKTVTDFISDQAEKARQRIRERGPRLNSGLDPVDLVDHAIIGADYIAKGFTKVADWSAEMIKDFGEKIRPYLDEIFEKSQQYHDAHEKLFTKGKPKSERTPEEITKSIDPAAGLDHQTVYDLARAHVRAGVEGFDNVMNAVHEDLKTAFPKLTERDVRDAFSEYGKVKFPSKDADKVKLAEYRRMGQLVSAIEDANRGTEPKKTGLQRNKPTQDVRELMAKLKDAMAAAGIDTSSSEARLAGRLDAYKTRLKNATQDINKRLSENNYAKPQKTPITLDPEALRLKTERDRVKMKIDSKIAEIASKNRTISQKFWDGFVGVQRAFKLSSDVVLAKLTIAALAREAVLTPAEEAVGGVLSKALPKLAERAPREGGLSLRAEIQAKRQLFTKGMADAWDNLQMKKSDLEVQFGKRKAEAPPAWYEYLGFLHGALKAPVKRAEFARSLEKRMMYATKAGENLNDPNVMLRLSQESYVDANRAIFMQDNVVSKVFNAAIGTAEKSKTAPNLGPAVARIARFIIPVVKVPTNLVGEVATGVHGTVTGSIRAAHAYLKGVEELPKDQGDAIMRQLKKGLVGNAILLTGYLGYKSIGGFYHKDDQRRGGDVAPLQYRVGNTTIPSVAGHSTAGVLLNLGATLHRVEDERAKGGGKKGLGSGAIVAGSGLVKDLPMIPALSNLSTALESEDGFHKYIHDMITSTAIPSLVQHAAKVKDTPGTFPKNALTPTNRRVPASAVDALKVGIPGLREQVPKGKEHHR